MGIISGIQAMIAVQKLKKGKTARLSVSQITNLIINLPDAQRELTKQQFNEVCSLYFELNKCRTKHQVDLYSYYDIAVDIIKRFDNIAPYEKYSGGNETEFSLFMDIIRDENSES